MIIVTDATAARDLDRMVCRNSKPHGTTAADWLQMMLPHVSNLSGLHKKKLMLAGDIFPAIQLVTRHR